MNKENNAPRSVSSIVITPRVSRQIERENANV